MSDNRIGVFGSDVQSLLTMANVGVATGTTFSASNNIATITTSAPHGLTFNPAAGVPPNYFVQFGTGTSGLSGTGILVGNTFRILSIPSTTTFTIYTTVTAATLTTAQILPVFLCPFIAQVQSQYAGSVQQPAGTYFAKNQFYAATVNLSLAGNMSVVWNTDGTFIPLDGTTGNTPATAPAVKTIVSASTNGQVWMPPTSHYLLCTTTAGTSFASVVN